MSDLISKQKAIDEIRAFQWQVTCSFSLERAYGMDEGFDHAVNVIELMDAVDAEPVRYTYLRKSRNYPGAYECSECGVAYPQSVKNSGLILDYCSKCGAKFLRGESV